MTVEAEALGARVDLGTLTSQPRVRGTLLDAEGAGMLRPPDWQAGRAGTVLEALRAARLQRPDVAVMGNLVGPFSLLGMLADPLMVLRWTRRKPEAVERRLEELTARLIEFGRMQAAAGADVLCIAEPTATGEILGSQLFRRCVLPHLQLIVKSLRDAGAGVIVHICGKVDAIAAELADLPADAVSFDSRADILPSRRGASWATFRRFCWNRGPRNRSGGGADNSSPAA
jgi:[methyl-Co(III) methanol-specific corrinoid protein]:coenzyme M methyltransferase